MHKPWRGLGFLVGDSCFGPGSRYKLARPRSYSRQPLARHRKDELHAASLLDVGEHNFILWITRLHSWWARKVSGGPRRGSWGGPRGAFGVLFVVPFFCFFEFRGDICVEIERGVFSVFQNIDYFTDFMCKSEIRVLSRFCFFWDLEMDPLKNVVIP